MSNSSNSTDLIPDIKRSVLREPAPTLQSHWAFYLLRDSLRPLLWATGIAFLACTLVAFLIPVRYEAVARLMPPDQSGSASGLMGALVAGGGDLFASLGSGMLGLHTSGATVVGILNSRSIQDDVVNQFDLCKLYGTKKYEDARRILQSRTSIVEDKKSGIISIAVQDHSPQRAAAMAQAYVDDLNSRVAELTTSAAHRERVFLEERLGEVKQQLDEATLRLSQFSSKSKTLDPQIQGKAMLDAASALQGQLIAAETELSGLRQIYGSENYRVKAAAARVGELRDKLKSFSGTQTGDIAKETSASQNTVELYPSLGQLPLLGNTYYGLARQAKIEEAIYEVLIKQYELAKVEEVKELPSIKVLDKPIVPERKSSPPRLLIIACGTILVFLCAGAFICAHQIWVRLEDSDPLKAGVYEVRSAILQGWHKPGKAGLR